MQSFAIKGILFSHFPIVYWLKCDFAVAVQKIKYLGNAGICIGPVKENALTFSPYP